MMKTLYVAILSLVGTAAGDGRLLALGDLHGDYGKAVEALKEMGVVDADLAWTGGTDHLVQLGDLTDRGDSSSELIDLFEQLKPQAEAAGGLVVTLLGNHEVLNLQGMMSYVHPDEIAKHGSKEARKHDYSLEGKYGAIIATYPVTYYEKGNLFVHAGLIPEYAQRPLDEINTLVAKAISAKNWKSRYLGPSGPLWTRSQITSSMTGDCAQIDATLAVLNKNRSPSDAITRMIVGHTIQRGGNVKIFCEGKLVAADVALSTFIARNDYLSYVDLTSGTPVVMGRSKAGGEEL